METLLLFHVEVAKMRLRKINARARCIMKGIRLDKAPLLSILNIILMGIFLEGIETLTTASWKELTGTVDERISLKDAILK